MQAWTSETLLNGGRRTNFLGFPGRAEGTFVNFMPCCRLVSVRSHYVSQTMHTPYLKNTSSGPPASDLGADVGSARP